MKTNDYKGKKVLILGLARSGLAAVKLLLKLGADITVSEAKPLSEIKELGWLTENGVKVVGQTAEIFEEDYDEVIKNPGINGKLWFVQRLRERGIPVTTEIELAFKVAARQKYIAITGTNGKTTTSTLLAEVLSEVYPGKVHLCGNIGIALCETILEYGLLEAEDHYIVLEISNFQLLDIQKFRPDIAVIINLAADHLDFMGSEDAYYRSKARVYENMRDSDIFLKNIDDPLVAEYTGMIPVNCSQLTYSLVDPSADYYADADYVYEKGRKLFPVKYIKVVGRHNVQNVLVATAAASALGADAATVANAIAKFKGVEHRIEFVREKNGVRYYNDSKGTNVDATVIALKAFDCPTLLLAGGHEKGLSFEPLKAYLTNVKQVIGYGACGERLIRELTDNTGILVHTLDEALAEAEKLAVPGDVILLSPTTSSFDQFSCFEERGEYFKELVNDDNRRTGESYSVPGADVRSPIGIFDSGFGGLTTLKAVRELLPNEDIVYFGDTARVPYGNRSRETLIKFVKEDIETLERFGVKAVVIACNTADSMARKEVENDFPIPLFGVVRPAAKLAAATTKNGKIGVISTNATYNSGIYKKLISEYNPATDVICVPTPLLVPLIENGKISKYDEETVKVLTDYLTPLKLSGVDTLVLGCTHYPLIEDIIADIMPGVTLINSGSALTAGLKRSLEKRNLLTDSTEPGKIYYYVSDAPDTFAKRGSLFIGEDITGKVQRVE